jgi:hypothetical protein
MAAHIPPSDIPPAPPIMIISETQTHIVVAVEIARATLTGFRRLLEQLIAAAEERRTG